MKKISGLIIVAMLMGCSVEKKPSVETMHHLGIASVTNMKFEQASAEKNGFVQIDATVAGVVTDEQEQIIYVSIDTAQNKGEFALDGSVSENQAIASKKELKEAYDMKKASPIQKEWYEQIAFLEEWMIGKTLPEIKAFAMDEKGYPTDKDVTSGVTMNVKSYLQAVEKAINHSEKVKASKHYGFANITTLKSTPAASNLGSIQGNTTFALVGMDQEGIVSVLMDTDQNATSFNQAGGIENSEIKLSKKLLKEEYGMKKASSIEKEWYEQVSFLENYLIGKNISQLQKIQMDQEGYPVESDVTSGVTMNIQAMVKSVEKAIENKK